MHPDWVVHQLIADVVTFGAFSCSADDDTYVNASDVSSLPQPSEKEESEGCSSAVPALTLLTTFGNVRFEPKYKPEGWMFGFEGMGGPEQEHQAGRAGWIARLSEHHADNPPQPRITFALNVSVSSHRRPYIELGFLRSYERVGRARVRLLCCEQGNRGDGGEVELATVDVDALWDQPYSQQDIYVWRPLLPDWLLARGSHGEKEAAAHRPYVLDTTLELTLLRFGNRSEFEARKENKFRLSFLRSC